MNSSPPIRAATSWERGVSFHDLCQQDQNLIAGLMAVGIVDLLEIVNIHQKQGAGLMIAMYFSI